MSKNRFWKRYLSLLLCTVLCINYIPINVLAATGTHGHTDDCYTKALVCEMEAHTHKDSCYKKTLDCSGGDDLDKEQRVSVVSVENPESTRYPVELGTELKNVGLFSGNGIVEAMTFPRLMEGELYEKEIKCDFICSGHDCMPRSQNCHKAQYCGF